MKAFLKVNPADNVVVALRSFSSGEIIRVDNKDIVILEKIERGHKIATETIHVNENIIKYGNPIGHAIEEISQGEWVHVHNTKTNLSGTEDYIFEQHLVENKFQDEHRTFKGYRRKNGKVGIRNELWIVPTVGCVNGVAEIIINRFKKEVGDISPFDNTLVLKHNYGCSQLGDDHEQTKQILANAVNHPNAAGVLVLGLGCENNEMEAFKKSIGSFDEERVKFLISQQVTDEIAAGVELVKEIHVAVQDDHREEIPLSELKIGLKCGGSDGFSGITANPLVGQFSDYIVAQGGTTMLTEVPEMFGAEKILMARAKDEEVFDKIVHLINDFKEYFLKFDQPVYENPSPGNKAGGITTLEDKSLGCTQKAGTATIVDVLSYGETIKQKGLNLLSSPGNDLVAASALASAGCQIVLFTTGRGTPFGTFVPTMKIATNTAISETKPHWIDFNAGMLLEDSKDNEQILNEFIDYVIAVANGTFVNNEKNDFRELAIFKTGVTL